MLTCSISLNNHTPAKQAWHAPCTVAWTLSGMSHASGSSARNMLYLSQWVRRTRPCPKVQRSQRMCIPCGKKSKQRHCQPWIVRDNNAHRPTPLVPNSTPQLPPSFLPATCSVVILCIAFEWSSSWPCQTSPPVLSSGRQQATSSRPTCLQCAM